MTTITCFDIGGTYLRYGALPAGAAPDQVVETGRLATPRDDFEAFCKALRQGLEATGGSIAALSMAGVLDPDGGRAEVSNIPCLHDRILGEDLTAALNRPVLVANDADCMALAETHCGSAKGADVVFGVILGTGVGGGVVIRGEILRGFGGISGEWGHGPVLDPTARGLAPDMPAFACGCGRSGCADAMCSARGLERLHLELHGRTLKSAQITQGWHQGDSACATTIKLYVELTARLLSLIVNTLGPQVVPVGGGLGSEPKLVAEIDRRVRDLVLARYREPLVVPAQHMRHGGLIGAGIVARQWLAGQQDQSAR